MIYDYKKRKRVTCFLHVVIIEIYQQCYRKSNLYYLHTHKNTNVRSLQIHKITHYFYFFKHNSHFKNTIISFTAITYIHELAELLYINLQISI